MGLVSRIVDGLVASSSPIGGSRTLQCGIGAHVVAWALMGREEAVTEACYPLPNKGKVKNQRNDKKILKKKLSMKIIGWLRFKPIQ